MHTLAAGLVAHESASVKTAEAHLCKHIVPFLNKDFDYATIVPQCTVNLVDVLCKPFVASRLVAQ